MDNVAVQKVVSYDPRWFVWTIMVLLITGVGLVSYIMVTSEDQSDPGLLIKHRPSNSLVQSNVIESSTEPQLDK